jgi:hypothetical protein
VSAYEARISALEAENAELESFKTNSLRIIKEAIDDKAQLKARFAWEREESVSILEDFSHLVDVLGEGMSTEQWIAARKRAGWTCDCDCRWTSCSCGLRDPEERDPEERDPEE